MSDKYPGGFVTTGAAAGYSVYFDGSGDYLTSSHPALNATFTIEAWIYRTSGSANQSIVFLNSGGVSGVVVYLDVSNYLVCTDGVTGQAAFSNLTVPINAWAHVAVVRSGGTTTGYVNGTVAGSHSFTPAAVNAATIARYAAASPLFFSGYISNVRVVNGTASYTGAFTPPTQLLNITNTSLLTCQSPTLVDNSTNNFTITAFGDAKPSTFTPFTGYTAGANAFNPALGAAAPGVWTIDQALYYTQNRLWPIYDPNFKNTVLMLHGNGTNGAQNNTFLDSSSNNFTITRNGNTTQGTYTPFSSGWSNYFGGSQNITVASTNTIANALSNATSANLTVECWVYPNSLTGSSFSVTGTSTIWTKGNVYASLMVKSDGAIGYAYYNGSAHTYIAQSSSGVIALNAWSHVAIVFTDNLVTIYVNGTSVSTGTRVAIGSLANIELMVGFVAGYASTSWNGYISNFRVVTSAVYSSSFTPPTSALSAIANTQFLTSQSNRFVDNSTGNSGSPWTITITGSPSIQPFAPFAPLAPYTTYNTGGSGYFDGSGDYLQTPSNTAFDLGTGDFTFECWVYATATPSDVGIFESRTDGNPGAVNGFTLTAFSSSVIRIFSGSILISSSGTSYVNAWCHVTVTRVSGTFNLYINGVSQGTSATARTLSNTDAIIGGGRYGVTSTVTSFFPGYITNCRIIKGQALTTGNFTPPTSPVTTTSVGWTGANVASSITGTVSLLLNFTNAGIIDSASDNVLETVGNAQISTVQSKWGGGSMAFDGTGDNLYSVANGTNNFSTGDFTIECWINFSVVGNGQIISAGTGSVTNAYYWQYFSNQLQFGIQNVSGILASNWTPIAGTWYHIAVTRSGTNVRQFVGGTQLGTTVTSSQNFADGPTYVGYGGAGYLNGYINDLRITKGVARYTANFTPPTSQMQDQ